MAGVVNVISRRPKDMEDGTTVLVGTPYASVTHSRKINDYAYKVSAGYFEQPAYERPTGTIPGSNPPQTYPVYENQGTAQSRVNFAARFPHRSARRRTCPSRRVMQTTDGILHSGIGPFDIVRGSNLSYAQADWNRGSVHVGGSVTMLDGDAVNLLTRGGDGALLPLSFVSDAHALDASNTSEVGERHVLTYARQLPHDEVRLRYCARGRGPGRARCVSCRTRSC